MIKNIAVLFVLIFFVLYFRLKEKFIDLSNIIWENTKASVCKKIFVDKDKIYKKCNGTEILEKINSKNFDFAPRMEFDYENGIIIEDYFKEKLTKKNKPKDYVKQLNNINNTLKKNNIYHNDVWLNKHLFVKDGKIKLIDWNNTTFDKPKNKKWVNNDFNKIIKYLT